jgi:hypothetical protein
MEGSGQHHIPAALTVGESLVPIEQEAGLASEPVLDALGGK